MRPAAIRSVVRRRRCAVAVAAGITVIAALAAPTWARSEKTLAYPREQAWPSAVRFLVVDEHVKVTEKDADAGYVLFELRDDGKIFRGSLEIVTMMRDGRTVVRFVLQLADRPSWLEIAMLRRLETKLRAELGSPTPPPDAPPKKEAPRPDETRPDDRKPDDRSDDRGPPVSPTP